MVTVDVFTMGWNEERILPHFIDHYKKFCRNITFYNNSCTDNSVEICKSNGVKVINTGLNEINDYYFSMIKENSYKDCDADFAIIVDTDEFLYHPDITKLLNFYKKSKINLPKTRGYTMATELGYPEVGNLVSKIRTGIIAKNYAKRCIFDPKLKIKWGVGFHQVHSIIGEFKESEQEDLAVLHYKFVDREEVYQKKIAYAERMSSFNKTHKLGVSYYEYDKEWTKNWFDDHLNNSIEVI